MDHSGFREGLPVIATVSISDFRKDLRRLLDSALTGREIICENTKSRDREKCSFIKTKLLQDILKAYTFTPKEQYPYVLRLSHCLSRDEVKQVLMREAYGYNGNYCQVSEHVHAEGRDIPSGTFNNE